MRSTGKKLGLVIFSILCVLIFSAALQAKQEAKAPVCIPIGNIELKAPASVTAERPSVSFPHNVHFDYSCKRCHHTWNGQDAVQGCMTSGCHDLDQAPKPTDAKKKSAEGSMKYYKNAYHAQCIGCHKAIKVQNAENEKSFSAVKAKQMKTGPTGCTVCHAK